MARGAHRHSTPMTPAPHPPSGPTQRPTGWRIACFAVAVALGSAGACDSYSSIRSLATGGAGGGKSLPQTDRGDIVFPIDNSTSMADKQDIMSRALGDMIT